MANRREFSIAILAGCSLLAAGVGHTNAGQLSEQVTLEALDPWLDTLVTGDPARVETVLAPE